MKKVLTLLAGLAALAVVGGYLGALHPLGDSLAVFRLQGAGALALLSALALLAGAAGSGRLGMTLALVVGMPVVLSYWIHGPEVTGGLRIYQKNMLFRNGDLAGLAQDIAAAAPDAVTLQEVSEDNRALLDVLKPHLPHQLHCAFAAVGSVAIATSLPPITGRERCAEGLAAMQVEGPQGPMWLVSVHLYWPWPHGQADQVRQLVPVLEGLDGPVVMAGDFNMARWSATVSALAQAARVQPVGAVYDTYTGFAPWLILPIDHVLSPDGGQTELRGAFGSDHFGLLAEVGL